MSLGETSDFGLCIRIPRGVLIPKCHPLINKSTNQKG